MNQHKSEAVSRATSAGEQEPQATHRTAFWWILFLACAGQFMVVLDISVVNVALPSIQEALGFNAVSLQWVVNAYALAFAGFLLLGGRLADLYGRKRIFVLGLTLFSAASLVGGMADAPAMLIVARGIQGLGAAILAPATLTILTTTFPEGPQRTRALAIWTAVGLGGGTAGNLLGGVLTQFASWRWTLLINVPLGALAIVLTILFLARDRERESRHRLDIPGAVLVTAGLASLTYGITQTQTRGWDDPATVLPLIIGGVALGLFLMVEARLARVPLMPLRLFHIRAISVGNVVMLLAGVCLMPMWYFLSLFMQNVLHYSALQTGVAFLPHTLVTIIVGARFTPWIMQRIDSRTLIIVGAVIASVGFLWQSRATAGSSYLVGILGPAVVFSIGSGLLITPITTTVTSGIDESDAGAASGLMNTTKQVGGALGLAVLVVIAASQTQTPTALAAGYSRAFLTIAVMLIVVAAASFALPARRDVIEDPSTQPTSAEHRQPQA